MESERIPCGITCHIIETWIICACVKYFGLAERAFVAIAAIASHDTESSTVISHELRKVTFSVVLTLAHVNDNGKNRRVVFRVCRHELQSNIGGIHRSPHEMIHVIKFGKVEHCV